MKKHLIPILVISAILLSGCAADEKPLNADSCSSVSMTGETVTDKSETVSKSETVVLTIPETRANTSAQIQKTTANTTDCPSSDSNLQTVTSPKSAADTSQPDRYEEETDKPVFSSASTTAAAKPHTTASEKKPAETARPETEKPETAKTEAYTTAQTAASSAPKEQPQTIPLIADRAEVEAKVAKYINEYRTEKAIVLSGLTEVARYRSQQLVTDFCHTDGSEACAAFKYGEYVDMTVYGFPESSNYYNGYNREAIAKVSKGGTADEIGKRIADAFRNSPPHWSYLSSGEYLYMAVGCTFDDATSAWYCCVCVSSVDYGG